MTPGELLKTARTTCDRHAPSTTLEADVPQPPQTHNTLHHTNTPKTKIYTTKSKA